MKSTPEAKAAGPFQKIKSSFREIFGKPETPSLEAKGIREEMSGKEREKRD